MAVGVLYPTWEGWYAACFSHGYLMISTREPFHEESLFKRFAKVFEQTYTRFLDLQNAEAQAREAVKRASLDRVRAETASMRTTADLEHITPLIWNELTTLGVPFIRCGVFIMDEDRRQVQTMLSTPEGKALATFHAPYDSSETTSKVVAHWRKKEIYQEHWDETALTDWTQSLMQQGSIVSEKEYLTENPPTHLHLHFIPFLQGILYVGSEAPLNAADLHLTKTLADVFSTAYARYEDFNKIETAKLQVEQTLTELRATQTQLIQKEKLASLGEMTAGIAHEIQNPLNFVNNFSEISVGLSKELNEEIKKETIDKGYIAEILTDLTHNQEKINHHGKRASAIVKGMMEHARTTTGEREPTDLNKLADEYLRLGYHTLRAKDKSFNADFQTNLDPNLPKVTVVEQEIGRALQNLFSNAFHAVNEKAKTQTKATYQPTVTVSTKQTLTGVEIHVTDNGIGIPQAIQQKIFNPFFTTKPPGEGTGLGLSLAYDMITKGHKGTLEVESTEGVGSEFIIRLPNKTKT